MAIIFSGPFIFYICFWRSSSGDFWVLSCKCIFQSIFLGHFLSPVFWGMEDSLLHYLEFYTLIMKMIPPELQLTVEIITMIGFVDMVRFLKASQLLMAFWNQPHSGKGTSFSITKGAWEKKTVISWHCQCCFHGIAGSFFSALECTTKRNVSCTKNIIK